VRVLGLNGWGDRSHDASACLLVDGEIVAFAEEERFSRRKHAFDACPVGAAAYCLAEAGITLDDVDAVAFGWDMPRHLSLRGLDTAAIDRSLDRLLPRDSFPRAKNPPLHFVDHHLAHAASAYHFSGADRSAVLVVDGQGEEASISTYHGVDGELRPVGTYPIGWSLGYMYEAACEFTGMRTSDSGKLMGLAGYGTPLDALDKIVRVVEGGFEIPDLAPSHVVAGSVDEGGPILGRWGELFAAAFGCASNPLTRVLDETTGVVRATTERDPFEYRDVAATVQHKLEQAVISVVDHLMATTSERVLTMAGGVAYNATLNGKIRELPAVGRLFVQPAAGDAGVALGAAAWIAAHSGDVIAPLGDSIAFGPQFTPDEVRRALDGAGLAYREPADLADAVAQRLDRGELIGWFNGRGEVGPRALGSRSLLASPADRAMRDRVNLEAKRREWWRPLAPSVAVENTAEVFGRDLSLPYMIVTTSVSEAYRGRLGAVVHEDGTTRPQTVTAQANPAYHAVLRRLPGGIALNTSFNGRDEPIVRTPLNAIATFRELQLDALVLGPYVVEGEQS